MSLNSLDSRKTTLQGDSGCVTSCDRAQERHSLHNSVQEESDTETDGSQRLAAPGLVRRGRTPGPQTKGI